MAQIILYRHPSALWKTPIVCHLLNTQIYISV